MLRLKRRCVNFFISFLKRTCAAIPHIWIRLIKKAEKWRKLLLGSASKVVRSPIMVNANWIWNQLDGRYCWERWKERSFSNFFRRCDENPRNFGCAQFARDEFPRVKKLNMNILHRGPTWQICAASVKHQELGRRSMLGKFSSKALAPRSFKQLTIDNHLRELCLIYFRAISRTISHHLPAGWGEQLDNSFLKRLSYCRFFCLRLFRYPTIHCGDGISGASQNQYFG